MITWHCLNFLQRDSQGWSELEEIKYCSFCWHHEERDVYMGQKTTQQLAWESERALGEVPGTQSHWQDSLILILFSLGSREQVQRRQILLVLAKPGGREWPDRKDFWHRWLCCGPRALRSRASRKQRLEAGKGS